MSFYYALKESLSGFKRVKISGIITIFTITVSLLLLGVFLIVLENINGIVQNIRNRIEIEAFLKDNLTEKEKYNIKLTLLKIEGIKDINFISKEEASKIFKEEFGEEINRVLDFNPLPESFKISLWDTYKTSERINTIINKIKTIDGIDDVIYRKTLLELLDRRAKLFSEVSLVIIAIISIISIFLISNTIRLIIYSKRKIIETMRLVGATERFIKTPFIIEGIFHGLLSGIIASLIIYIIIRFGLPILGEDLLANIKINYYFYVVIILSGCLLSLIGSIFSTQTFIKSYKNI